MLHPVNQCLIYHGLVSIWCVSSWKKFYHAGYYRRCDYNRPVIVLQ